MSLKELAKYADDGSIKPRFSIFDREIKLSVDREIEAMHIAYSNLCERMESSHITGEIFENAVDQVLHPENLAKERAKLSMLERFQKFIHDGFRDGIFAQKRMNHYMVVYGDLERFLLIKGLKAITPCEFTADMLMDLRDFFANEYLLVKKYAFLYVHKRERDIPSQPRDQNTVVTKLKKLQAFFNELEDKGEIMASPFRKLGRKRKASVMREKYDDPVFLRKEEFLKVMHTEVPSALQETKDCFLLQCAFGCRIADFQSLTMEKLCVTPEGIPYVHYLPHKTMRENDSYAEVETPVMKYALQIIKKWNFNFPILKYVTGKSGYNAKIKRLLEYCQIDRACKVFDDSKRDNVYRPLYEFGSSKLCRKTHVDIMNKVQVNLYAAGLHKEGSLAVNRYTKMEMLDRFRLMCTAFEQPYYTVDEELNILEGA
jgi:integrase